jgi:purine-cytosine permease-like protein
MADVTDGENGTPPPAPGPAYPPPPAQNPPPAFDDDALAAALEASYTQPIAVVPPAAPPVVPQAAPPAAPPAQSPAYESDYEAPDVPEYVVPPAPPIPDYVVPPAPPASEPEAPAFQPQPPPASQPPMPPAPAADVAPPAGPTTLDAIQRLEDELRRRTTDPGAFPEPAVQAPVAPPQADWLAAPPPTADAPVPEAPRDEPPAAPPPLVEPAAFGAPPVAPSLPVDSEYVAPTVLPPVREVRLEDVQGLPPPIGQQAAPLPPYDPNAPIVPATGAPPISPDAFAGAYATPVFVPEPSPEPPPRPLPGAADLPTLDENDDAVDDIDRIFGAPPVLDDDASAAGPFPSEPLPTQRVTESHHGLLDQNPENHPVFVVEHAGAEPTAHDLRAGRAARLFWLWFATNSSVVSLAIGAVLFTFGISLRQAIVATLAGVALSFLPLGLGTLAGKWSGQPTMVVSRATFGLVGNILPAVLGVVTRAFWGAVLLWVLAVSVGNLLVFAGLDAGLGASTWTFAVLGIGALIATVIALFGYGFVAMVQLVSTILSGLLVAGLIVMTYPRLDLGAALAVGDGAWTRVLGGAVLVFSFVGLAWVQSSSDVARYQRPASSGAQSMLWASLGATIPPFVLIVWGAMLAASDPDAAAGLAGAPLEAIARMLPLWYPAPLLAAAALGLISSVVLAIYSGGFALQSLGLRARRSITSLLAAVLVVAIAAGLVVLGADAFSISRDLATTLAVPVAAWAGIFSAEMMIRTRRFDSPSLLAPGGVYPQVRAVNLIGFLLISALGFGLTSATFPGLTWQGYLFPLLGIPMEDPFAQSDSGVLVALLLGVILALATAIPAIRRQERESLRLEHTGPVPRITGSLPRVTGPTPRLEP